ncbi:unnamed protein product [Echinostoma caproni]|uniref:ASD2 domain-containing protein n=1 Tax=Echinostoma caproni TaxID=27848 RepID=A0A183APV3_9TREM|nr:unnamed protein product [Echinostoma caproni]
MLFKQIFFANYLHRSDFLFRFSSPCHSSSESDHVSATTDSEEPSVTSSTVTDDMQKQPIILAPISRPRHFLSAPARRKEPRVRARIPSPRTDPQRSVSPNSLNSLPSKFSVVPSNESHPRPLNSTQQQQPDWSPAVLDSLPSVHTGSGTSSVFSSPAHQSSIAQSRLAAKQKFCLEPPKPFTIDPKQFVSSRNRDRCVSAELSDCSEQLESISDPDVRQASVDAVESHTNTAVTARPDIIEIFDDAYPRTTNGYQPDGARSDPPVRSVSKVPIDDDDPQNHTDEYVPDWQERKPGRPGQNVVPVAPFAALDEFPDIDSMSTLTERSSTEHRTDSDHRPMVVRDQSVPIELPPIIVSVVPPHPPPPPPRISASNVTGDYDNVTTPSRQTVVPAPSIPCHRISVKPKHALSSVPSTDSQGRRVHSETRLAPARFPGRVRSRAHSAKSNMTESDTSEETSSADLDSVLSIRPLPGAFARITPRSVPDVNVRLSSSVGQESRPPIPNSPSTFRLRCADRNRRTMELNRELESLENTMWQLEQAGVQAERELYSIGPRRHGAPGSHATPPSSPLVHAQLSAPHSQSSQDRRMRARARTLNYHVSHVGLSPGGTSSQHSQTHHHGVSERRYLLLKRLASLLATKSMLLEYASTLTERREQLRLANEQEEQVDEDRNRCLSDLLSDPSSVSRLTRCLSDPSLSQVQLNHLAELQASSQPAETVSPTEEGFRSSGLVHCEPPARDLPVDHVTGES